MQIQHLSTRFNPKPHDEPDEHVYRIILKYYDAMFEHRPGNTALDTLPLYIMNSC